MSSSSPPASPAKRRPGEDVEDRDRPTPESPIVTNGGSSKSQEALAFLSWVRAVAEEDEGLAEKMGGRGLDDIEDLCDGVALLELLAEVDPEHFKNPHTGDTKDNWVLKIGTLKRLYKLMLQYYTEIAASPQSVADLPVPDLDLIARSSSSEELCKLCRLTIGVVVLEKKTSHIEAIQTLAETDQQSLMVAIAEVMAVVESRPAQEEEEGDISRVTGEDEEGYETRPDTAAYRKLVNDKDALERAFAALSEEHTALQGSLEDAQAERDSVTSELATFRQEVEESRSAQADVLMRQEIERLKAEVRRTEDALAETELEVEHLGKNVDSLTKKNEDLSRKADEASKLKDQVDEFRHAADKLQRTENVIEKYKKKLEEGADVRRQLKVLEDQNAELVNKNTALEDEYKRVAAFKPLMDSYKSQISELESKSSNLQRDLNTSRYDHEQTTLRLRAAEEARAKEKEEIDLYQERITELEMAGSGKRRPKGSPAAEDVNGVEGLAAADENMASAAAEDDDDLDPELTGELEAALSGTSISQLKIQVRRLARELEAAKANKADVSRIIVLENLLDDANRMKARYESDYLKEHQSKLVLQNELEAIRNGKSNLGDGPEAAIALRTRLIETVDEMDELKRSLSKLTVEHEQAQKELTIAKSDLTLVNRDQLDILQSLRASVNVEKEGLEATLSRIRDELAAAEDRNKMLMTQVTSLLMDKVDMQSEGITQREEALRKERNLGELRASLAGKSLPKAAEDLITGLQSSNANTEAQLKAAQDKLQKAKQFIRQQDRLIKEQQQKPADVTAPEDVIARLKRAETEAKCLRKEQVLMASAFHELTHRHAREHHAMRSNRTSAPNTLLSASGQSSAHHASIIPSSPTPRSWLGQQRQSLAGGLSFISRK